MTIRKNISSGAPWEDVVGYSRAVVVGNHIEVSGTVASDENGVVEKGNMYGQTRYILEKIRNVLVSAGFSLSDVIRTRIYVTDISQWEAVAQAHGEYFRDIKPASAMIEVSRLIDPEFLVEIEVTALKS